FVFALSPILIRITPAVRTTEGLLPGLETWGEWKPWVIVAIALVYATGVAGNRAVEVLYHDVLHFEAEVTTDRCPNFIQSNAELAARHHSETARDWVERHKTYAKILRAASFSSVLFLAAMVFYRLSILLKVEWEPIRLGPTERQWKLARIRRVDEPNP